MKELGRQRERYVEHEKCREAPLADAESGHEVPQRCGAVVVSHNINAKLSLRDRIVHYDTGERIEDSKLQVRSKSSVKSLAEHAKSIPLMESWCGPTLLPIAIPPVHATAINSASRWARIPVLYSTASL